MNAASKQEIVEVFCSDSKTLKHYAREDLEKLADKIIALRAKMMPIDSFEVGGIHRPEQLFALRKEVPLELLNSLRAYYYPHSSAFKAFVSESDGQFDCVPRSCSRSY